MPGAEVLAARKSKSEDGEDSELEEDDDDE